MATKSNLIRDVYYNMNKSKCESAEFIRAVRNNPALYDPDNSDYKMATVKDAIWKDLAGQFGVTCDVAKKRWKSLRDTYTKKFRISEEHAGNFKYGKELLFLKPYMKAERSHVTINKYTTKTKLNTKSNSEIENKNDSQIKEFQFEEISEDFTEKDFSQELDTKIFISQVKEHPSIWNQHFNSYNILEERNRAWLDIAKALIEDFEHQNQENQNNIVKVFRRKWRRLREKYVFTRKAMESRVGFNPDKMFPYFYDLSYIESGIKIRRELCQDDEFKETDSNFGQNMKAEYLNETQFNEHFEDENIVDLIQDTEIHEGQIPDTNYIEEDDEDRLFLLSLVKEMKKIPKDHKLDARLNILVVLRNWQKIHYARDSTLDDYKDNVN